MSLTLTLPPELEKAVAAAAAQNGVSPHEMVQEQLELPCCLPPC